MLRHIVQGLCTNTGGRRLVASAIGVLAGVECLLSSRPKERRRPAVPVHRAVAKAPERTHYFTIRRTTSDLGLTYWVLQGFGCYQGFTLLDTWQEAMDEATTRINSQAISEEPFAVLAGARA